MKNQFILLILLLIIAAVTFLVYKSQDFIKTYRREVLLRLEQRGEVQSPILTEDDLKHLPTPVQKYLRYADVIGKEKVHNVRVVCEGEFRPDPQKGWYNMSSQQYNFFTYSSRLYFIKLDMSGIPVLGLHCYKDAKASMLIKLAGVFKIADARGPEMNTAETVTVFNDMCFLAPATLIDQRVEWETLDSLTVKATFKNNGCKISAVLYFNERGELINFISDDRSSTTTGDSFSNARWSTPMKDYQEINGVRLASYGEAIWQLPEGDYCYIKVRIKELEYNTAAYK